MIAQETDVMGADAASLIIAQCQVVGRMINLLMAKVDASGERAGRW